MISKRCGLFAGCVAAIALSSDARAAAFAMVPQQPGFSVVILDQIATGRPVEVVGSRPSDGRVTSSGTVQASIGDTALPLGIQFIFDLQTRSPSIFLLNDSPAAAGATSINHGRLPEPVSRSAALPANASSIGVNLSRDGNTEVGCVDNGLFTPFHAFRWSQSSGIVDLGTLDPANNNNRSSFATDVSSNGSVIVGYSDISGGVTRHAFRWTQAGGMVDLGSSVGAGGSSGAYGVSGDGNVVVGETDVPNNFGGSTKQAFRWTSAGGFQRLGAVEADFPSVANAVTADGAVVAGMSGVSVRTGNTSTNGSRAFRWTQAGGLQNLGALPGHQFAVATGVSDDGTMVVGISSTLPIDRNSPGGRYRYANTTASSRAFYWTAQTGIQDLNQLLTSAGANLEGGTIVSATGISANGRWIMGNVVTPTSEPNTTTVAFISLTETLTPPPSSRLANLSTRAICQTGDNVLIPGFVVSGTGNKRLLIRAVGPKLTAFGVTGVLPDPQIVVKRFVNSAYVDFANNDNWGTNANSAAIVTTSTALGAFPLDTGSLDSVLLLDVPAGQYTVVASGVGNTTGIGIVELYDGDATTSSTRLSNIANRGFVGTGDNIMVMGYVISEGASKRLLIRAVGPTLGTFGVSGTLVDPRLVVFRREPNGSNTQIATNDDWGLDANAAATASVATQVSAFALPANSQDAAVVLTLPSGSYTVQGSGAANGTGVALLEIYEVP